MISAVALSAFIVVELMREEPLIQLRLLPRRNFGFGTLGNFLLGFALYGAAYLLPQYLAVSQGYRRAAERRGDGLDRAAAAVPDPAGAAADAAVRFAAAGRGWA